MDYALHARKRGAFTAPRVSMGRAHGCRQAVCNIIWWYLDLSGA
jgi:hypothetical protein